MDYLCAKFGDFSFSRFGFIVRTDRQTDRHRGITEADQRYTHATTVGVSNYSEQHIYPPRRLCRSACVGFLGPSVCLSAA